MRSRPWKDGELASAIETLRRHTRAIEAIREHNKKWRTGRTVNSLAHKLRAEGLGGLPDYLRIAAQRRDDIPVEDQVRQLVDIVRKAKALSAADLCNRLDVSPRRLAQLVTTAQAAGFRIQAPTGDHVALDLSTGPDRNQVHRLPIEPVKDRLVVAVASDIHFASRLHRRECLEDFVRIAAQDYGVRHVMVPGDVTAGINMYRGQLNEIEVATLEGQARHVIEGLPKVPGLAYHMIGGNHDEAFLKAAGAEVLKVVAGVRPDVRYYGFHSALVDVQAPDRKDAVKFELHHPDKAGAYAITYHAQKEIEQIPGGMKPQILLMGHTHQSVWLPDYRGVSAFYCGTFEDQTLFLRRKHIAPHLGGWILSCGITKTGALKEMTATWVRYFHSRRGPLRVRDREHGGELRMDRAIGKPVGDGDRQEPAFAQRRCRSSAAPLTPIRSTSREIAAIAMPAAIASSSSRRAPLRATTPPPIVAARWTTP